MPSADSSRDVSCGSMSVLDAGCYQLHITIPDSVLVTSCFLFYFRREKDEETPTL